MLQKIIEGAQAYFRRRYLVSNNIMSFVYWILIQLHGIIRYKYFFFSSDIYTLKRLFYVPMKRNCLLTTKFP